jgi:hypothetical protein
VAVTVCCTCCGWILRKARRSAAQAGRLAQLQMANPDSNFNQPAGQAAFVTGGPSPIPEGVADVGAWPPMGGPPPPPQGPILADTGAWPSTDAAYQPMYPPPPPPQTDPSPMYSPQVVGMPSQPIYAPYEPPVSNGSLPPYTATTNGPPAPLGFSMQSAPYQPPTGPPAPLVTTETTGMFGRR